MESSFLSEVDGVDDLPVFGDVSSSAAWEQRGQVYELVVQGNRAFRDRQLEDVPIIAISLYSKALRLQPNDPIILNNRSAAFYCYSQRLRNRPAALSEIQALSGMDPTVHSELALKDAEKALKSQSALPKSYYRKAMALKLLERYSDAREAFLSGLQVDPSSIPMQEAISDFDQQFMLGPENSSGRTSRARVQRTDDFDCTLCLKMLYDPVTTPCGHSFCRGCLFQSMDHGNKCPMCRTVLLLSPRTYPLSVTLNNIIQKNFPEEYAERKAEQDALTHPGIHMLPLFVMDIVLPCQKLSLNIFEPRYRLMTRRIMEGSHRMGMVGMDSTRSSVADVGCEVEICECEPLPDGRFLLQVEGRRRFRIIRSWDQDGYRVAEVDWFSDACLPNGTREREDLQEMARGAADLARSWMRRAGDAARTDRRRAAEILSQAEGMPGPHNTENFSFWFANLLNMRPTERLDLLRLTDTREQRISRGLDHLRADQGCRVQ
ncbi:uncharacterized protein LOC131046863 isoform X3 [Cryptomeria japonica]|uniref:uncharacterized protein LOC131046863 isoform X3 n=1 Tax=Cryptomeria japonica TaxID=3369 RepID=UPI0027DA48C6|nr:uncharacterized protein LOC131046863 isoform X3 [Cryptomeria japonica]